VPRIENRVTIIRENYHWVPRIRENRAPKSEKIIFGSLESEKIGSLELEKSDPCRSIPRT